MTAATIDRVNPWQARAVAFRIGEQLGVPLDSWTAMMAAVVQGKLSCETVDLFVLAAAQEADRRCPGDPTWTSMAPALLDRFRASGGDPSSILAGQLLALGEHADGNIDPGF